METFVRRSPMPVSDSALLGWHARPGAFERLTPPWEPVEILERPDSLEAGTRAVIQIRMGPFRKRWVAEHRAPEPGAVGFDDVQVSGPFARWHHRHRMHARGGSASELEDRIEYALPLGFVGRWLGGRSVRRKLDRMFRYRHDTTARDLEAHAGATQPLKIVITGASGFLGRTLVPFLTTGGHEVVTLARGDGENTWDPAAGRLDPALLEGADAVIHLAGENVAGGRWSKARKDRILRSRVDGTDLVARTLASMDAPPGVFLCASAVGIYGAREGSEALDESSPHGDGFLADVVKAWEAACAPARDAGVRVVNLRFGVVLGASGGALGRMLTPFRLCLGGRLGNGRQVMSWVSVDDAAAAVLHALSHPELEGPVNVTAPAPVTNHEFTKTLGRVLRRPTILPVPGFALRLLFGEMGDAVLLRGARVVPSRLLETGFTFRHPDLESCLRHALGRTES